MNNQKFFRCKHCGNFIGLINNAGVPMVCCGEEMIELVPNTVEASQEKHIPFVTLEGNTMTVQIGSVLHPSTEEHYIDFIYVQTEHGGQRKSIKPGDNPIAVFKFVDDKPLEVFAYCNLHGLWSVKV
jgi:superoxide reductase